MTCVPTGTCRIGRSRLSRRRTAAPPTRQSGKGSQARGGAPVRRLCRQERSAHVFGLIAQQRSHAAKPVVFIPQQRDGVRDVLDAAQIQRPDLRFELERRLFEFHGDARALVLAFLRPFGSCVLETKAAFEIRMPKTKPKVAYSGD